MLKDNLRSQNFYFGRAPGRPRGYSKTGGRQAGPPNERSVVKHWLARFPDLALHAEVTPLEFLMRVAAGDRSLSSLQLRAARAALPYMHAPGCGIDPSPRLKATLVRIAEIKAGEG